MSVLKFRQKRGKPKRRAVDNGNSKKFQMIEPVQHREEIPEVKCAGYLLRAIFRKQIWSFTFVKEDDRKTGSKKKSGVTAEPHPVKSNQSETSQRGSKQKPSKQNAER